MARMTGQSKVARLGIGAQVALTGLLALAAVLMINWLAARPQVRVRWDLTETEQNTLSTATQGVLDQLPAEVTIDVFFREEAGPLAGVAGIIMARAQRMLGLFRELSYGNVRVRYNDTTDADLIEERKKALRLHGIENCLVVSYQGHREVVRVKGDLGTIDPGQPDPRLPGFREPRLVEDRIERAVSAAILKVTKGDALEVVFLSGHSPVFDTSDETAEGMSLVRDMLMDEEGFLVNRWNPNEGDPFPDSAALIAVVGPSDPLSDETLAKLGEFVQDGGRLVVASPPLDADLERSRLNELLTPLKLEIQEGLVCQLFRDPSTGQELDGHARVAMYGVNPNNMGQHELMRPFRSSARSFLMNGCHPVRFTGQPHQGTNATLFTSEIQAWVDLPNAEGNYDLRFGEGEPNSRKFSLAAASRFRPDGTDTVAALEAKSESRVVVVGSANSFNNQHFEANRDFVRNIFNWALAREYRLSISPKNPDLRLWPDEKLDQLPSFARLVQILMPGLCLILGIVFAVLRSRGGITKKSAA